MARSSIKSGPLGPWLPARGEIHEFTPALSKLIMDTYNTRNRKPVRTSIKKVAAALEKGEWSLNGETIIFASDGTLLDGQNRLQASIDTGISFKSMVAFGMNPDVFPTIDKGRSRNLATDLEIAGEEHCLTLAAALQFVYAYLSGVRSSKLTSSVNCDYEEAMATLEAHTRLRASVQYADLAYKRIRATPKMVAAVHYLIVEKPTVKLTAARDAFFTGLEYGENITSRNPVAALRKKFADMDASGGKTHRGPRTTHGTTFTKLHCLVKAWNCYIRGEELSTFRLPPSSNPENDTPGDLPDIITVWSNKVHRWANQTRHEELAPIIQAQP